MQKLILILAISFYVIGNASGKELLTGGKDRVLGRYLVVLQEDVDVETFIEKKSIRAKNKYKYVINGFAAELADEEVRSILNDLEVNYVESDGIVQLDRHLDDSERLITSSARNKPNDAQEIIPWGVARIGGPTVNPPLHNAWVVDTGIDVKHVDLNVNVARSKNFVSNGKNTISDLNGHGTHVAGIIGAKKNGVDVVGVAPNSELISIRVLDEKGSGLISWLVAGLDHVMSNAEVGDIVNMSITAIGHYETLHNAVLTLADAGIKVVIAAGNYSDNTNNYEPAHVEHDNVYTVSSYDESDCMAWFSNYFRDCKLNCVSAP